LLLEELLYFINQCIFYLFIYLFTYFRRETLQVLLWLAVVQIQVLSINFLLHFSFLRFSYLFILRIFICSVVDSLMSLTVRAILLVTLLLVYCCQDSVHNLPLIFLLLPPPTSRECTFNLTSYNCLSRSWGTRGREAGKVSNKSAICIDSHSKMISLL